MLYSSLIVAASALAGFASAQNSSLPNTIIPCCQVPVNNVPEDTRDGWCNAQRNTCVSLCGGQGEIAANGNDCKAVDLDYTCKCSNGTDITDSMASYQQTVPGQMCRFWFDACINATGQDASEQFNCIQTRDSRCGNITIDAEDSTSSSASASGTGRPTSTGSGSSEASATSSGAPANSQAAAAVMAAYGTPALAGGLLALFGLAL